MNKAGWAWSQVRRIAALGEPLLELQSTDQAGIAVSIGGDVANSCIGLMRLLAGRGIELRLVTALGNSTYSDWLRTRLRREGIALHEPPTVGEPGIYGAPLVAGRQAGFSYWRSQSAARGFLQTAKRADFDGYLAAPDVLLVTGITLALCSPASFASLCEWVQKHADHCRVVFDCNFRRTMWPSEDTARTRIGVFESLASIICTSTEDECMLWQARGLPQTIERLGANPVEYLIRDGQHGCWAGTGSDHEHVATTAVKPVDTAGAGDAHLAGYLAARIAGRTHSAAAQFGNQVAAVIVQQRGSAPAPEAPLPTLF